MAFSPRVETLAVVAHQNIDHTNLPLALEPFQWTSISLQADSDNQDFGVVVTPVPQNLTQQPQLSANQPDPKGQHENPLVNSTSPDKPKSVQLVPPNLGGRPDVIVEEDNDTEE
jgi:hypothetical protein